MKVACAITILASLAGFVIAQCPGECDAKSTTCNVDPSVAGGYECLCKNGFKTCEQDTLGSSKYDSAGITGMHGLYFDIRAKDEDVTISNFGFQFNGGGGSTYAYTVYTLNSFGPHLPENMLDETQWTPHTGSAKAESAGAKTEALNIVIPAGKTQSFFLHGTGRVIISFKGSGVGGPGNIYKEDSKIALISGRGSHDSRGSHFGGGYGTNYVSDPKFITVYYGDCVTKEQVEHYSCISTGGPSGASGDPHIKTWFGETFDFHGGCDLVLLDNGIDLAVHIRTKIESWWSYIESAVLQIGEHTLEVMGAQDGFRFWVDGQEGSLASNHEETSMGVHSIEIRRINEHQSQFRVDVGEGNAVSLETMKRFVRVNVVPNDHDSLKAANVFGPSLGLMGAFVDGSKTGRDGTTIFTDVNKFGLEWQVLESEPNLFHSKDEVRGSKCVMPDDTIFSAKRKRRLGEASIGFEDASTACARVNARDREACIADVMVTQDKEMAASYSV